MTKRDRQPLSNEVLRRKGLLFDELAVVLEDRLRTGRTRRATAAAAGLAVVAIITLAVLSPVTSIPPDSASDPRFEIVSTVTGARPLEAIDDDELLDELRAAGLAAGLVRTDNRVFVVSR